MADETTPENPEPTGPAAPKKPAARKPSTSGPGAAPRKPAAKKPAAGAAPAASEVPPAVPVAPEVPSVPEAPAAEPASAVAPAAEPAPAVETTPAIPVPPVVAPAGPAPAAAYPPPPGTPEGAPGVAPVAAPAKRKIWPFVLGGGILLFIAIVVGIVVAVGAVLGAFGGDPKTTVTNYDKSFETADCELFQSTTTESFQQGFFQDGFDCDAWVDNAEALTVDGVYSYSVKIVISKVDGDNAEVVTNETDSSSGSPVDYTLRYFLTKVDGHWLIDGISNES